MGGQDDMEPLWEDMGAQHDMEPLWEEMERDGSSGRYGTS